MSFANSLGMKFTAWLVLIAFSMLILEPTAVAAQQLYAEHEQQVLASQRQAVVELPNTLKALEAHLTPLAQQGSQPMTTRKRATDLAVVETLKQEIERLDALVQQNFAHTTTHLTTKQLPAEILARQQTAIHTYTATRDTLFQHLTTLQSTTKPEAFQQAIYNTLTFLQTLNQHGQHAPFDPNQLPFGTPQADKLSTEELKPKNAQSFFDYTSEAKSVQVAALSGFMPLLKFTPPVPADLQPTEDIKITPEIKALAASTSLDKQPVKIYNWVHDNIQFIPTSGSLQGAQMTLETRQGNATDTASLLIALLRAAGIHSRYAVGTVRIPIAQVMNWVGGQLILMQHCRC